MPGEQEPPPWRQGIGCTAANGALAGGADSSAAVRGRQSSGEILHQHIELGNGEPGHVPEDARMATEVSIDQTHSAPHAACWTQWYRHDALILTEL